MKLAPLQLADYWATTLHVDANPKYDTNGATELDIESIRVQHDVKRLDSNEPEENGAKWLVNLAIEQKKTEGRNIPYSFKLVMQGVVLSRPDLRGEKLEKMVAANGPAMLFGSAREIIRAATGRGPYAAVIIPSTNFLGSPDKKAALEATQIAEKAPANASAKNTKRKGSKNPGK